jgi:hypothetical protein
MILSLILFGGLAVFIQLTLLRLLSSLVNVDCVLTVYSVFRVDGIGLGGAHVIGEGDVGSGGV